VELYGSARPESCLGCGCGITAGDVVVPAEPIGPSGPIGSGWLLCLGCGAGLLLGQPLPAWPAPPEAGHAGARECTEPAVADHAAEGTGLGAGRRGR
jgi:hypothetical protein